MDLIAEITTPKNMRFIIHRDSRAGFYIYVFENGVGIADYLQDTLEIAKEFTLEEFGVPLDAWKQQE